MKTRTLFSLFTMAAVLLLGAGAALAQSGPAVDWWVIAGGGSPSTATGISLIDTLGQPVAGPSEATGLGLNAGYWVACHAPAAAMPDLGVSVEGDDVALTWPADQNSAAYRVWVETNPYFDPDVEGPATTTTSTTYTDEGAAVSLENHYYVVRGLNLCGAPSVDSPRRGEFTFGLTPGSEGRELGML